MASRSQCASLFLSRINSTWRVPHIRFCIERRNSGQDGSMQTRSHGWGCIAPARSLLKFITTRPARRREPGLCCSMSETKVSFQNTAGNKLVGIFTDAGSQDVVVLCHGYACSKDGFRFPAIAKALAAKKLSSLRFDFTGNGESEGAFEFAGYMQEVSDLRCAVTCVRDVLHRKPVALLGHSKGGNAVLLYSAQYDDVPFVVNVAGRFNMRRGIKERLGEETLAKVEKLGQVQMTVRSDTGATIKWVLTKKAVEERMNLDMEAAARNIRLSEVLTIHGTEDKTIPPEDGQSFAKCIRQHCLCLVEGADHNFRDDKHADQMIRKAVSFIADGLN